MSSAARPLLSWLSDPGGERGIRFAGPGEEWDFWSYSALARLTRRTAAGLVAAGVGPGDVVSLVARSGPRFVGTLFGTMLAGATPSPIAPPLAFGDRDAYCDHVVGLLSTARPSLVVTEPELVEQVRALAAGAGVTRVVPIDGLLDGVPEDPPAPDRPPAELALLQFTSGSSGRARGVRVPHRALEANVEAIRRWLAMGPEDPTATWLPVHHDMGLIGCLITPVVNRSDVWLMQPEDFVRNPARFLRCFGRSGARLTAMPTFGLRYVARRVRPEALEGCDFSAWRTVIVGAERVEPAAMDGFVALLAPHGLRRTALLPAYGLAEATLAVTGLPLEEEWGGLRVDPASLELGGTVRTAPDGQLLAGCGRPLAGVGVRVLDEDGAPLPDSRVGEIEVRGDAVAAGYAGPAAAGSSTSMDGGVLRTGDAGFLADGQLYVLGRLGDAMKVRGRTLFAEDLEAALGELGVPGHRMAVLLGEHDGRPTAVAVLEQPDQSWLAGAGPLLSRRTEGAAVVVVDAPRGAISRTSSGKPKRRLLWRTFVAGDLPGVPDRPLPPTDRSAPAPAASGAPSGGPDVR